MRQSKRGIYKLMDLIQLWSLYLGDAAAQRDDDDATVARDVENDAIFVDVNVAVS